jgi:RHS repeat-associated protein
VQYSYDAANRWNSVTLPNGVVDTFGYDGRSRVSSITYALGRNDQVKFATFTRDGATGLDYADQCYYSNQFGRFMTPDPYKAGTGSGDPQTPQSWNRYTYVQGDPINFRDRKGLLIEPIYYPGPCDDEWGCWPDTEPDFPEPPPPIHNPLPRFLQVTRDCYRVPANGGPVTREID